jgi:ABC-type transport system substrate-binding protein
VVADRAQGGEPEPKAALMNVHRVESPLVGVGGATKRPLKVQRGRSSMKTFRIAGSARRRRHMAPIALLLSLALVTAACGNGEEATDDGASGGAASGESAAPSDPEPQPVDLVRWAGPGPVTTLDGKIAGDASSMIGIYFTSGQLTRFDADRQPRLDLAESVVVSDDGLQATVTLLPGLVYSDGTPVLAVDIQYAVERNRDGTGASFVRTIESVDVIDDRTAVLNLVGPDPDLLSWMAERGFQLHPKSQIEADPDYFNNPVSAGPYVVEAGWVPGAEVFRAVENPNYHKGPMMARAIEHVAVPDVPSRILQLNAGQLDMAYDLPLSSAEDLDPAVEVAIKGVGGMNYIAINQELGGPFASYEVRRAISLAIDRSRISNVAFFGFQPPATSPFFSCGPLCRPGFLPNGGVQDLDAARELMAEAGFADGFSAEMKVSSGRGGWPEAAVLIAEDLAKIGINITVTPVDEGQHFSSIGERNYEMFFSGGGGHYQALVSQVLGPTGFWVAATGATPPAGADELVVLSGQALDVEERAAIYDRVQQMWADYLPIISVVERVQLTGNRVPGILIPQVANDQKLIIQSVAEARAGVRAGDL